MVVIPGWISQASGVDFGPETVLLTQLEAWAGENGWVVSDGGNLPFELRQRTDVLFEQPGGDQSIRVAEIPKRRKSPGVLRLDSSTFRTLELVYRPKQSLWRVEAGGIPIEDDLNTRGWTWLVDLLFKP